MTTVTRESFGGGGGGRGAGARGAGWWKRLWQVPLLIAGLVLFGLGVRALSRAIRPVPFDVQIKAIHSLQEAGEFPKAIEQINIMAAYYKDRQQQLQLECLAGDTFYYAEKKQGGMTRANWQMASDHYQRAVLMGAEPTPLMNERWGEVAMALEDWRLAIQKFEAAGAADEAKLAAHGRELVAAYMTLGQVEKADGVVDRVLGVKDLDVDDRVWGLCKKIELAMAREGVPGGVLEKAVATAIEAVKKIPERDPSGRVLLWIGRAELDRAQADVAREHLQAARDKFLMHHLDDGRAAILLGKIAQQKGDLKTAEDLYREVATSHAGTNLWPAARLGRAEVLALRGQTGAQMEADYRFVIKALLENTKPELVTVEQVRASLAAQYQRYAGEERPDEAMKFMVLQAELKEKETPAMAWRLATTREKRAMQLLKEAGGAATMPAQSDAQEARQRATRAEAMALLAQAAEDYLRHAKLTTMEDTVSGNSYWKAAQLFDEAGETEKSIDVYDKFTLDRPRDPRVPEALLAIGRLYESSGKLEKAIVYYKRNIDSNPKTPAAYVSQVNLARCYMAQGPAHFAESEDALLKMVQGNGDIEPTANEFRASLFMLGELYYRNGKWAEAILRLEEAAGRYPEDREIPRADFMLGECYRRSAQEIGQALKSGTVASQERREALEKARVERLMKAADLLAGVIVMLDSEAEGAVKGRGNASELESQMVKTSYMDRAECYSSAGDFAMAIKLYDLAATRFSQDQAAADAYLQMIHAYLAMNQPAEARAAAERARWVIKRIPDDAFGKGPVPLTRKYYEDFLALSKQ